ncbi:MAG: DUF2812 domain-containing protein [Lachnospiraceae bacterium]|nr:DUF2812 domain-containing protein [Lachnospiraceae bacterium]
MSIVKRRYFAGFLGSQTKWLNSMAAKGYRLTETGKLKYVFDECTPGQYIYTVEYVGDRSLEDEENYKAFLEDMGYRVFYKNLNLDYSLGKVTFRPWADRGGRISTLGTTYNKELLIVEKENDGTPFDLHTEKEDRIEYYSRLSYPWYFAVFLALLLALIYWPNVFPTALCGGLAIFFALPIIVMALRIRKIKKESKLEE